MLLPSRSRSRPTQLPSSFYHYKTNNIPFSRSFSSSLNTSRRAFPSPFPILSNSSATCSLTVASRPVSSSAVFPTAVPPLQQYPTQQYSLIPDPSTAVSL